MTIEAIAESIDGLPDGVRRLFVEKDGRFSLDVSRVAPRDEVSQLKSELQEERDRSAEFKTKFEKARTVVDQFGDITPSLAKKAIKAMDAGSGMDPEERAKELMQEKEQQLLKKHDEQIAAMTSERDDFYSQLRKELIQNRSAQILATKFPGANVQLLMPHIERQTDVMRLDDGVLTTVVLNGDAKKRISAKPGSTALMDIEELLTEMSAGDLYAAAFPGTGSSGTGKTAAGEPGSMNVGRGKVSRQDQDALNSNIEDIASGAVTVVD
jgi:hypothetical protein